jgi:hypothetical protein
LWLAHWLVIDPLLHGSPRTRTFHALEALIQNQEEHLAAITDPSTSSQAVQWLKRVGPIMKRQIEGGARTEIKVIWQKGGEAETAVDVHLGSTPTQSPDPKSLANESKKTSPRTASGHAAEPVKITKLNLFWKRASGGPWLLVGNAL